jgi:hypothetical protein
LVRLVIGGLAIFGLVSLFSSGTSAAAAGAGAILLAPLLLFAKVAFFMFLFGMVGRGFGHHAPWRTGRRPYPGRRQDPSTDAVTEADFEEWHRLRHARDEVDGWVSDVT